MPFIQNISITDIVNGHHKNINDNGILIQIVDFGTVFPAPKNTFIETYRFEFLDLEEEIYEEKLGISDEQAQKISSILVDAFEKNYNVIVHCHAGVSRSGAIAEIGIRLGFEDTKTYRKPNKMILKKLINFLPSCKIELENVTNDNRSEFE